jgi:peptidoglycan/xylan/chitin deacetylase (PgdA/CDA1 family)
MEIHYYRAGETDPAGPAGPSPAPQPRLPRRRRRRRDPWRVIAAAAGAVLVLLVVVAVVSPWFGHLGLPWPGGGGSGGGTAAGGSGSSATTGSSGAAAVRVGDVTVLGAGGVHTTAARLRFVDSAGAPVNMQWRVDGGPWRTTQVGLVRGPQTHANDGTHTVQVRAADGSGAAVSLQVRIDTTPPQIGKVTAGPQLISDAATMHFTYDVPAGQPGGAKVDWAVVDTLGQTVGRHGSPHDAAGTETVAWVAKTASGDPLFPGTYRFQVTATDANGAKAIAYAPFGSDRAVTGKLYTRLPKAGKLVALTFDGGSGYAWRYIMRALTKLHAKGTFFCTGVSVEHYPFVAKDAVAQGMTLGNHSFDHPDFQTIGYAEARTQLQDNAKQWWKACQALPTPFFRPPYGSYNATTLKAAGSAGYPFVVNWDVDTGDWTGAAPAEIARRAIAGAHPGSIICMHTEWNTEKAIPAIVKGLRAKGLEPVGLDTLFHAAGLM